MKNRFVSILFVVLLAALMIFITGCPRVQNKVPTVIKVSGPSGTISQRNSTFSWNGSDPDGTITKYEYKKDGDSWVSSGTSKSYTWNGYSEGTHKFEVRAQDNVGKYSESVYWNFEYSLHEKPPTITWQQFLGGSSEDGAYAVQQTDDGGFVVFGFTYSNNGNVSGNHGNNDFWVVKLDSSGSVQWQKCLGGSAEESGYLVEVGAKASIQQTNDGGYVIVGFTFSNDGDVSGNHGSRDVWVVKLNNTGSIMWQRCLGGSNSDCGHSIQQTAEGGYIVAGHTGSNNGDVSGNHGGNDFWVVKLDSSGGIQWQKCLGGSNSEWATSVQQSSDGGYVIAGATDSNDGDVSGNHGGNDFWVVKLDSSGGIQWQKCLGGSNSDHAHSIKQTNDGGYVIVGFTFSNDGDVSGNHGSRDVWVVKLDSSGSVQWQKCLGEYSYLDLAFSVKQTSDNGYVVAGLRASAKTSGISAILIKLDVSGNSSWQMCLDQSRKNLAFSVQQTNDSGYVVAGTYETYDECGDLWIIKLH